MGRFITRVLICVACLSGAAKTAQAEFIRVDSAADTYLSATPSPTDTHGSDPYLHLVGDNSSNAAWPLMQFDLTPYQGRVIQGAYAYVRLYVTDAPYDALASQIVELHSSLAAWTESGTSLANFAGGIGVGTGSIGPTLSTTIADWDETPRYVTFKIPKAVVQSWIDHPETNLGVVLVSNTSTAGQDMYFASRENSLGTPPVLEMTLAAVPEPSTVFLLVSGAIGLLVLRRRFAAR